MAVAERATQGTAAQAKQLPLVGVRPETIALPLLVVVAAALRFSTLTVQSFWSDEAVTASLVKLGFLRMLETIPHTESTPPLYYVLAWGWVRLFGDGEAGLRSLSALIGCATVVVAYGAGRTLVSRRTGLVAAALVAANPLLVWYSQEARSYALLVLLGIGSVWLTARTTQVPSSLNLGLWTAVAALALVTHFFALFLIAPEAAWLLVAIRRTRVVVAVAAVVAVAIALLPLALYQRARPDLHHPTPLARAILATGPQVSPGTHGGVPLRTRVEQVAKQFAAGYGVDQASWRILPLAMCALMLVGAASGVLVTRGRRRRVVLAVGTLALVSVAIPLLLAPVGLDYLVTRNVLAALVPTLLVVAAGFAVSRIGVALAAALCLLGVAADVAVASDPAFQREDWRGAAGALGAPTDRAIVVTPWAPPSGPAIVASASPLALYMPHVRPLPAAGVRVDEVDVVAIAKKPAGGSWAPAAPENRPPAPPFHLVAQIKREQYTVVRYRSARPVPVTPRTLVTSALGGAAANTIDIDYQSANAQPTKAGRVALIEPKKIYHFHVIGSGGSDPNNPSLHANFAAFGISSNGADYLARAGDEQWFVFSVLFPRNFPTERGWAGFSAFKGLGLGFNSIANLGFDAADDKLHLYISGGNPGVIKQPDGSYLIAHNPDYGPRIQRAFALGPVLKGVWQTFILHVVWSNDPKKGLVALYRSVDGAAVQTLVKPTQVSDLYDDWPAVRYPVQSLYTKGGSVNFGTVSDLYETPMQWGSTLTAALTTPSPTIANGIWTTDTVSTGTIQAPSSAPLRLPRVEVTPGEVGPTSRR